MQNKNRRGRVLVCTIIGTKHGGSKWDAEVAEMAVVAGELAAKAGFAVLTGGRSGVMERATHGASRAGALTIGITPGTEFAEANKHCDLVIPSGIGYARNIITALAGDCVLALPGGHGTLQEMSYAIEYDRPVCSWDSWTFPEVHHVADRSNTEEVREWLRFHMNRLTERSA